MDKVDNRCINVNNQSRTIIYSIMSPDDKIYTESYYSEFCPNNLKNATANDQFKFVFEEIKPNTIVANHDGPRFWDSYFNGIKDGRARLYIVSKDSVEKYGWSRVFKDTIYVKKYALTLAELEKIDWEITYK